MAIEFAHCVIYSRSQGKNAVQAAAYRSASRLYDERTGQHFDFGKKPNVAYSDILLPTGADSAFLNREYLWNQVEAVEKRKDAQLAKDYILALPKELSLNQNKALARQFAQDHFVSKGLVVDLNIHLEGGNPHAHLLVTTRRLLGRSFSGKARDLNPEFWKGQVVEQDYWGSQWRDDQNQFFKANGIDLSVDANHLIPTRHRGRQGGDDRIDYLDEDNGARHEMEREIALHSPESLLNILSERHSAFTDRDLACVVHKATSTSQEFERAMAQVKAHPELVTLGPGDDGRIRYATRQSIKVERRMEDEAALLDQTQDHIVSAWRLEEQIAKYSLNRGQQSALEYVLTGNDLALVVGKAGTGKSYMMNAAREAWEAEGYRVLGVTVSGIAAEGLESGSRIASSTIASFTYKLKKGKLSLSEKDIIVLDEAGMVDSRDLSRIVDLVRGAGAKLVLVGDPSQVQAIRPGAPFRALLERFGFAELTEIKRQTHADDRVATTLLSLGKTATALDIYAYKGQVFLSEKEQDNLALLIGKWGQHVTRGGKTQLSALMNESLILAHRNEDVGVLNQLARDHLIRTKMLSGKTHAFHIDLMVGERILFLENNWSLKVKNGHFATIKAIEGSNITAVIGAGKKAREIRFDAKTYQKFDYGYAATVHKTQGVTLDNTFLYVGGTYWNRNLAYVALSRHRDNAYIFADKETHRDFETLKKHLGRLSIKDSVIDFPLNYAIRRGLDPDKVVGQCLSALHQVKSKITNAWNFLADVEAYQAKIDQLKQAEAKVMRREEAVKVAEYIDLHRNIGRSWAEMKRTLVAGAELSTHPDFAQNCELITRRNALAHLLYQNAERYELAIELNQVNLLDLKKQNDAFVAKNVRHSTETVQPVSRHEIKAEYYNADRISEALINMGETFYQHTLGDLYVKSKHQGNSIRVGNKGSFSLTVRGTNAGAWHSFETGEGGYPLQLLMNPNYGYGLSFEEALKEGARIAGLSDSQAKDIIDVRKQKTSSEIETEAHALAEEKQKKIETARYYVKTSKPIEGTIAERYLRETRHIEGDLSGFRFHPNIKDPETNRYYPAALIVAKNEKGEITATQTILLDPITFRKAEVEVAKRTRGVVSGAVAQIHQGSSNKVILAEGPETGASLIKAMPDANIYVTVGNIRNAEHLAWLAKKHQTDTFYFAADNDGINLKPAESLQKAAQVLEDQGIKCYKAVPQLPVLEKPDFNDVLIHQGVDGVKAQMGTMIRILNESEKITFKKTPDFVVAEGKIRLAKPLLAEFEKLLTSKEEATLQSNTLGRLAIRQSEHPLEFKEAQDALTKVKAQQLTLFGKLAKQTELWTAVDRLSKGSALLKAPNTDTLKFAIKYNEFEPRHLQVLHLEMKSLMKEQKLNLQQEQGYSKRVGR